MSSSLPSILVDATQLRDLHSGVARRLINLWPLALNECKDLRIGIVAYEFMHAPLSPFFPDSEILVAQDFGEGPSIRRRLLNPHLAELRVNGGYDWICQDGMLPCDRATILTIHDLRFMTDRAHPPWRRALMLRFLRWKFRRFETPVMTVSSFMKKAIVDTLGVKAERVFVVPNGVDTQRFTRRENIEDELGALGLSPGNFRLFVGHLEERKNPKFLLDLHRYGREQGDHTTLVVAAHTRPAPSESQEWKQTWQKEPGVVFCESPEDQLLAALYQGASAFLMPSLAEGFSMTPLEAIAMKTPVLASAIEAHIEVLSHQFCQPLNVDTWHHRLRDLEASGSLDRLMERADNRLCLYSWPNAASQLADALETILHR